MQRTFITLALGFLVLWGLFYVGAAAKAAIEAQSIKLPEKVPCIVSSKRSDEAMDLTMHAAELSNPDFLAKFAKQAQQPMAQVDFPLLKSEAGTPLGRDLVAQGKAFVDSSFARWTFPYSYNVDGKPFLANQSLYPVPLWIDPRPDFSRATYWASYDRANPQNAQCIDLLWWQASKLLVAGLVLVIIPGVGLFLYNQPAPDADDKSIDQLYNERFKRR